MTPTKSQIGAQRKLLRIFEESVPRIAGGESLQAFCDWFGERAKSTLGMLFTPDPADPDWSRRLALAMARGLWGHVPVPALRWRVQALPKPDRNAPCYCASGRKFKQCCTDLTDLGAPMSPEEALAVLLAKMAPERLNGESLRQIAPASLAHAAMTIAQKHGQARVADLLEPLFLFPAGLDARYDQVFEILMDALLDLGQEVRREKLVRIVSGCPDKSLSTSARCRHVTMLVDRGEFEQAWALFGDTQRMNPNDPQLLHLELVTLLAQGRSDEAALRAPMLAAKARKLGETELAAVLLAMGRDGLRGIHEQQASEFDLDQEEQAWLALLRAFPQVVLPEQVRALFDVTTTPPIEDDDRPVLEFRPVKALEAIERRWRKRFAVGTPMLTMLDGEADSILDEPGEAMQFLTRHPQAWLSVNVLDDLLMAAREMVEEAETPAPLLAAARALAAYALEVCRALAPAESSRVMWGMLDSRPFLRVLAQAIEFARQAGDAEHAETLMRRSLALNPNDNHGWRDLLVLRCLSTGRAEEALRWLDRYPDDMAPAAHNRALALFMVGHKAEAEAALRTAHAEAPNMTRALLADVLDKPPDDDGPGVVVGGDNAAFFYRGEMRPAWVRSGALAWLSALDLPVLKPRRKTRARAGSTRRKRRAEPANDRQDGGVDASFPSPLKAGDVKALKANFPEYERLRGFLTAIAWSPGIVMPNAWLPGVMAMCPLASGQGDEPPSIVQMNEVLGQVMNLCNHFNSLVLTGPTKGDAPLEGLGTGGVPDWDWRLWAAGFVQGAEFGASQWRAAGLPVKSDRMPFKALYGVAAQAPGRPKGWRATDAMDQPLLTGIDLDPEPVQATLQRAMNTIWQVVAPMRQRRVAGGGPGE
jgi:yecA family protein